MARETPVPSLVDCGVTVNLRAKHVFAASVTTQTEQINPRACSLTRYRKKEGTKNVYVPRCARMKY